MKKLTVYPVVVCLLFLLTGCPYGYKYDEGKFPVHPVNIGFVNSMYDDYNMTAPWIEGERYLLFSSNRNSHGEDYDVVGGNFRVEWDKDEGTLQVDDRPHNWRDYRYVDSLLLRMNDEYDQLGPYSVPHYLYVDLESNYTDVIIYADGAPGNLDLSFVSFQGMGDNPDPEDGTFSGPEAISFLNTPSNDAYLAFWGPEYIFWDYGVEVNTIREVYFCSDRNGDFDIFHLSYPVGMDLMEFLGTDTVYSISPVDILKSEGQDKCPFINGSLLVFASDRPGGYGGFDLYYSIRQGGSWSQPENFGDKINTEHNEFRPIAWSYMEFEHNLLLFSSDRPGGKGGYDLYYVGIPRMIESVVSSQ